MRMLVIGLIVLAVFAAGGTVMLVKRFLNEQTQVVEDEAQEVVPVSYVLVAGKDMPAGTTVISSAIRWRAWPEDGVQDNFVASPEENDDLKKQFVDTVVRRGIAKGVPITANSVFRRDKAGFLSGALAPGMRAVSLDVTASSGASGFVLPGDRVDVIVTHDVGKLLPKSKTTEAAANVNVLRYTAETIVEDVRVLAVDQKVDDFEETALIVKTVTLEVTPEQAEILAVGLRMGRPLLTLRALSVDDVASRKTQFTTDLEVSPTLARGIGQKIGDDDAGPVIQAVRVHRPPVIAKKKKAAK